MPPSWPVRDGSALVSLLLDSLIYTFLCFVLKEHSRLYKGKSPWHWPTMLQLPGSL
ncbi:hypothetical protein BDR05DRAFT_969430 [Suillus weaverae]|nr:hypothetical protein BDR05DRAFT_969430 [Suillus weaverae]